MATDALTRAPVLNATPEIVIAVTATADGDWLTCGLCNDMKFVPLLADQAAWERTSRWIAAHRVAEHVDPLMRQGRN
jgi:hypothetical protein